MTKSCNRKRKSGRPAGRKSRYPGIVQFCRTTGYSHQHVRECLDGDRPYGEKVRALWAKYQVAMKDSQKRTVCAFEKEAK